MAWQSDFTNKTKTQLANSSNFLNLMNIVHNFHKTFSNVSFKLNSHGDTSALVLIRTFRAYSSKHDIFSYLQKMRFKSLCSEIYLSQLTSIHS